MSTDLNSVTIVGRLTRDVEIKYSASVTAIARFSVANTQSRKQGDQWVEEGHFFDCVGFGRRFDALSSYLTKGQQVAILGTLQQSRWQDAQTGQNRSRVEIKCDDIQLVGGKSGSSGGGNSGSQDQQSASNDGVPQYAGDAYDDDIPF